MPQFFEKEKETGKQYDCFWGGGGGLSTRTTLELNSEILSSAEQDTSSLRNWYELPTRGKYLPREADWKSVNIQVQYGDVAPGRPAEQGHVSLFGFSFLSWPTVEVYGILSLGLEISFIPL